MFEFSVSKMLALEKVRDIVLDNKHGVRYVGVGTIEPFMYDHKRTLALNKHFHWRYNEPMLPEWEWIILRPTTRNSRTPFHGARPQLET